MQLEDIPFGYCHCGCGERTNLAPQTVTKRGWVKGQPLLYIHGHRARRYRSPTYDDRYVERDCGYVTPCWVWVAGRNARGYGYVTIDGRAVGAHRIVYELHIGPIPDGLHLDHLCRNHPCVCPGHLEPVTNAENAQRGYGARVTRQDVAEIRRLHAEGIPLPEIGRRYGLAAGSAWAIASRRTWRDV